jgi:hypothetical protein
LRLGVFAGNIPISFLRSLRPLRLILRLRIFFGCGYAVLGALWLTHSYAQFVGGLQLDRIERTKKRDG